MATNAVFFNRKRWTLSKTIAVSKAYPNHWFIVKAQTLTSIPRTSYQYWHDREQRRDLNAVTEDFFRQPEGIEFLHRLTLAAEFSITQLGGSEMGVVQTIGMVTQ